MKKLNFYLAATFITLAFGSFSDAYARSAAPHSSSGYTAVHKLGRGLAGMTTGFLEVPGNIVKETQAKGAVGLPIGLATGVGMLVTRELVGVYEFISAPFPVPSGFRPILNPEYPWDYFE